MSNTLSAIKLARYLIGAIFSVAMGMNSIAAAAAAPGTDGSLSEQMAAVDDVAGQAPSTYIVQERQSGLKGAFEFGVGGGKQVNSSVYVTTTETKAFAAYHWSDRFFSRLEVGKADNQLTRSGEELWDNDGIFPDVGFVRRWADLTLGFNLIYGKARITKDNVFYFDQYVALGGGALDETNGDGTTRVPTTIADVGLAFWFGRRVSVHLGAKDTYFEERRIAGRSKIHHVSGYSSLGVLLGGAG